MARGTLTFRISEEVRAALEKAAEEEGRTASNYVERAVLAALKAAGALPDKPAKK